MVRLRKMLKSDLRFLLEIRNHISFIKEEILASNKAQRMLELKNWLDNVINN